MRLDQLVKSFEHLLLIMPRKITIFEPHFHDAQFGPTVNSGKEDTDEVVEETTGEETERSGGLGKVKYLIFAGVIAAIGFAAYKKLSGDDSFEITVEELETEEATPSN